MSVINIDHIPAAVKDLEAVSKVCELVLGKTEPDVFYIDKSGNLNRARYLIGKADFELMESTFLNGDVAKFIEKPGESNMLIRFNVENTRDAMQELESKDYPFKSVKQSFRDRSFVFVQKKMNGVLLEIIDDKWREL